MRRIQIGFRFLRVIRATVFVLAVAGCGAGGSADLASEASAGLTEGSPECGGMSDEECDMFHAINAVRAENGLASFGILSKCVAATGAHAEDMVARQYFSHDAPDETWSERMARFGLKGASIAENIAYGNGVAGTVQQWMNSPGHRANILSKNISTGVGLAINSTGRRYWVQCFSGYAADR